MDLFEIAGYVPLGMLGLLALLVLSGIFFGMLRGGKRTTIRIITFLVFFTVALFITPTVSKLLVSNIKIPYGGQKQTISQIIESMLGNKAVTSVQENMPDVKAFMDNASTAIVVNSVVFMVLILLFKMVSFIFYKIIASQAAPKKDINGEKIKHSKLIGMAFGAVQGFVVFMFLFIPINGILYSVNEVAEYAQENAISGSLSSISEDLDEVYDLVNDKLVSEINGGMKGSDYYKPYNSIIKISGIQALSNFGFDRLSTVKAGGTSVNLRADIVDGAKIMFDLADVAMRFDDSDISKNLQGLNHLDYLKIDSVIDKIFELDVIELVFSEGLADFLDDQGVIDEISRYVGVKEHHFAAYGVEKSNDYKNAIKGGIANLRAGDVSDDLKSVVNLVETFFKNQSIGGDSLSIHKCMSEILDAIADDDTSKMEVAFDNLKLVLDKDVDDEKNLVQDMFGTIADMNLFSKILGNPEFNRLPLMVAMGLDLSDASLVNRCTVAEPKATVLGLGEIILSICSIGPDIVGVNNVEDQNDVLDLLSKDDVRAELVNILDQLTNKMGTKGLLRAALAKMLDSIFSSGNSGVVDMSVFTKSFKANLESDKDIMWDEDLTAMKNLMDAFNSIPTVDFNDLDAEALVDALFNEQDGLLDIIADSPLLSGIVVDVIENQVNDLLRDSEVQIDFGDSNPQEIIKAIGPIGDTVLGVVLDGDMEVADAEQLFDTLGDVLEVLVDNEEIDVNITIPDEFKTDIEENIDTYWKGDENLKQSVLALFGIGA